MVNFFLNYILLQKLKEACRPFQIYLSQYNNKEFNIRHHRIYYFLKLNF